VGIVAWVLGGAAAMLFMGLALAQEMDDFPGGPEALAASVMPAVEAMRPLRWPAERLDTLGGYLTFHNIVLVQGFLAIYAAIQGARAVRGAEDRHSLEQILATGWSRPAFLRDRALGFAVALVLMSLGLALGTAGTFALADEPALGESLITMTSVGLCAFVAYAFAVLMSQLTRTSRSAAGIAVMVLVALYLGTNVWEEIGPLGVVRFVSPFYYANFSRALVPGYGADLGAMAVLLLMAVVLLAAATVAFVHRDYGAALWARAPATTASRRTVRVQRWWLRTWWTANLAQHRWGLLAWTLSGAAFAGLMMALQPTVMDAWSQFDFMAGIMGGGAGESAELLYTSFALEIVAPVLVGYVIAQAAGWVADLEQGRVESVLSAPVSWTRLVAERLLSAGAGVLVIVAGVLGAVLAGSVAIDSSVDAAGVARLLAMSLLLGWAIAALAAIAVAAFRSGVAVTILAVYVGAAYLLTWMIPIFDWPAWVSRLSVFEAFGHPYQEWPPGAGLLVLVVLAAAGSALAAGVAERTPKVA
jgi:ABC-2 type transport system permease protein